MTMKERSGVSQECISFSCGSGRFSEQNKSKMALRQNEKLNKFDSDENEEDFQEDRVIGGFFTLEQDEISTEYSWTAESFTLNVYRPSKELPSQRVAWWDFSPDCVIRCAAALYFDDRYPGLVLGVSRGSDHFVCFFDVASSRVLLATEIPFAPVCLETILDGHPCNLIERKQTLHPKLHDCRYLCLVGTQQGHALVVNLPLSHRQMVSDLSNASICKLIAIDSKQSPNECFCVDIVDSLHSENGLLWQEGSYSSTMPLDVATVTAVHYSCVSSLVFIGFEFGGFLIFDLGRAQLQLSLMSDCTDGPVRGFSVQEPENDPKPAIYVWVTFGATDDCSQPPLVQLWQLSFETKKNGFYKGLEGTASRFIWSPDGCKHIILSRCVGIKAKPRCDDSSITKELPVESKDTCLNCFVWVTEDGRVRGSLFDINAWYRALFPIQLKLVNGQSPFLSSFDIVDVDWRFLLDFAIESETVKRFSSVLDHQDCFYWPSAISFKASVLTVNFVNRDFMLKGIQEQALDKLEKNFQRALERPETVREQLFNCGLISRDLSITSDHRSCLLSLLLDSGRGHILSNLPSSFDSLINEWLWNHVQDTKESFDEIAAPLFDLSGIGLSQSALDCANHHQWTLERLAGLQRHLMGHEGTEQQLLRQRAMECVALYARTVLLMTEERILPETSALKQLLYLIQESTNRKRLVAKRQGSTLFVDKLCGFLAKETCNTVWPSSGNQDYPPKSTLELLSSYLSESDSVKEKHALILYFLLDLADAKENSFKTEAEETIEKFGTIFLDYATPKPALFRFVQAQWYSDCGLEEHVHKYDHWRKLHRLPFVPPELSTELCLESTVSEPQLNTEDENALVYKLSIAYATSADESERLTVVKEALDSKLYAFLVSGAWNLGDKELEVVKDALFGVRGGDELWNLYLMRAHRYSEVTLHKSSSTSLTERGRAMKAWIERIRSIVPDFDRKNSKIELPKPIPVTKQIAEPRRISVPTRKASSSAKGRHVPQQARVPQSPLHRPDPPTPAFQRANKRMFELPAVPEHEAVIESGQGAAKRLKGARELMGLDLQEKMHRRLSTGRFEDIKSLLQTPPVIRRLSSFRDTLHSLQPPLSILKSNDKSAHFVSNVESEASSFGAKQLRFDVPESPEEESKDSEVSSLLNNSSYLKTPGRRSPSRSPSVTPVKELLMREEAVEPISPSSVVSDDSEYGEPLASFNRSADRFVQRVMERKESVQVEESSVQVMKESLQDGALFEFSPPVVRSPVKPSIDSSEMSLATDNFVFSPPVDPRDTLDKDMFDPQQEQTLFERETPAQTFTPPVSASQVEEKLPSRQENREEPMLVDSQIAKNEEKGNGMEHVEQRSIEIKLDVQESQEPEADAPKFVFSPPVEQHSTDMSLGVQGSQERQAGSPKFVFSPPVVRSPAKPTIDSSEISFATDNFVFSPPVDQSGKSDEFDPEPMQLTESQSPADSENEKDQNLIEFSKTADHLGAEISSDDNNETKAESTEFVFSPPFDHSPAKPAIDSSEMSLATDNFVFRPPLDQRELLDEFENEPMQLTKSPPDDSGNEKDQSLIDFSQTADRRSAEISPDGNEETKAESAAFVFSPPVDHSPAKPAIDSSEMSIASDKLVVSPPVDQTETDTPKFEFSPPVVRSPAKPTVDSSAMSLATESPPVEQRETLDEFETESMQLQSPADSENEKEQNLIEFSKTADRLSEGISPGGNEETKAERTEFVFSPPADHSPAKPGVASSEVNVATDELLISPPVDHTETLNEFETESMQLQLSPADSENAKDQNLIEFSKTADRMSEEISSDGNEEAKAESAEFGFSPAKPPVAWSEMSLPTDNAVQSSSRATAVTPDPRPPSPISSNTRSATKRTRRASEEPPEPVLDVSLSGKRQRMSNSESHAKEPETMKEPEEPRAASERPKRRLKAGRKVSQFGLAALPEESTISMNTRRRTTMVKQAAPPPSKTNSSGRRKTVSEPMLVDSQFAKHEEKGNRMERVDEHGTEINMDAQDSQQAKADAPKIVFSPAVVRSPAKPTVDSSAMSLATDSPPVEQRSDTLDETESMQLTESQSPADSGNEKEQNLIDFSKTADRLSEEISTDGNEETKTESSELVFSPPADHTPAKPAVDSSELRAQSSLGVAAVTPDPRPPSPISSHTRSATKRARRASETPEPVLDVSLTGKRQRKSNSESRAKEPEEMKEPEKPRAASERPKRRTQRLRAGRKVSQFGLAALPEESTVSMNTRRRTTMVKQGSPSKSKTKSPGRRKTVSGN